MNKQKGSVKIKAGELQNGLQRFSFIVDTDLIKRVKELATEGVTMKALMDKILKEYLLKIDGKKIKDLDRTNKTKSDDQTKPVKKENKTISTRENPKTINEKRLTASGSLESKK